MSVDDVHKSLAKWLKKAKGMPSPPSPTEQRGRAARSKREPLRQLNLKVAESTYGRIKALAYRDRHSLVGLLDEMLDLYEKERGALEKQPR